MTNEAPTNLGHVLRLVLGDNKGQVLTEALCLGIENSILYYMQAIEAAEKAAVKNAEATCDS